jgi:hypothetical protein
MQFVSDPFVCDPLESTRRRSSRRGGCRIDREARERKPKACQAKHAQRVSIETVCSSGAQNPAGEIFETAERILEAAAVERAGDRVDGEVPALEI